MVRCFVNNFFRIRRTFSGASAFFCNPPLILAAHTARTCRIFKPTGPPARRSDKRGEKRLRLSGADAPTFPVSPPVIMVALILISGFVRPPQYDHSPDAPHRAPLPKPPCCMKVMQMAIFFTLKNEGCIFFIQCSECRPGMFFNINSK